MKLQIDKNAISFCFFIVNSSFETLCNYSSPEKCLNAIYLQVSIRFKNLHLTMLGQNAPCDTKYEKNNRTLSLAKAKVTTTMCQISRRSVTQFTALLYRFEQYLAVGPTEQRLRFASLTLLIKFSLELK